MTALEEGDGDRRLYNRTESKVDVLRRLEESKDRFKSNFSDSVINQNEVFILTEIPQEYIELKIYSQSISVKNLVFSKKIDLLGLSYDNSILVPLSSTAWVKLYFQFFSNGAISALKPQWVHQIKSLIDYDNYDPLAYQNLLAIPYKHDLDALVQQSAFNQVEKNRRVSTLHLSLKQSINFAEVFDSHQARLGEGGSLWLKTLCNHQTFQMSIRYRVLPLEQA